MTGRGGFSVHVGEPIAPEQQHLEDAAAYFARDPPLEKLVYLDGEKAVVHRSRMDPLERNLAMDHRVTSMTTPRGRAAGAGIGFDAARQRD